MVNFGAIALQNTLQNIKKTRDEEEAKLTEAEKTRLDNEATERFESCVCSAMRILFLGGCKCQ